MFRILVILMRLTRTPYFLRRPGDGQSHLIALMVSLGRLSLPLTRSAAPGGTHVECWGGRPVTNERVKSVKSTQATRASCALTACVPYLSHSVPGPAYMPTQEVPLKHTVIPTTSITAFPAPWLCNADPYNLLRWPPNLSFHLVWKPLFQFSKQLPIGRRPACLLPVLWLKCSLREHVCIRLLWLAQPTVFASQWSRPSLLLFSCVFLLLNRLGSGAKGLPALKPSFW